MKNDKEYNSIIKDIVNNKKFNQLKKQKHHGISRYEHSMRVAKWTYKMCVLFRNKKIIDTTQAALLHDFYEDKDLEGNSVKRLGIHPQIALKNSLEYFYLTENQKNIIETHMFPCNLNIPKYKESWLVSLIDKTVSSYEIARFKLPRFIKSKVKKSK